MIRTLIFDIGNVLAAFNWRRYLNSWQLSMEENAILERALFMSPMWKEVDRGCMSDEELLRIFCRDAPGYEELVRRVFSECFKTVEENSYAADLLKSLKEQGYRIYILSNYGKSVFENRTTPFRFLDYTDGQVISYREKCIKPEPEIYEILLSRYGICPEEAVFFDDLPRNLEAAAAFGIHTVHVTGYESIIEGLRSFGIEL